MGQVSVVRLFLVIDIFDLDLMLVLMRDGEGLVVADWQGISALMLQLGKLGRLVGWGQWGING